MPEQNEREELLNDTIGAYVESVGHLPSQDEMPGIVSSVDRYLAEEHK